jgi:hypothetical protein
MQDFWAALFVFNVQNLIVRDINDELAKKNRKYLKVSKTLAFVRLF